MRGDNSDSAVSVNSRLVRNRDERHIGRIEVCSISIHFMKYSMQVVTQARLASSRLCFVVDSKLCCFLTFTYMGLLNSVVIVVCWSTSLCFRILLRVLFIYVFIHFTHNLLIMGLSTWKIETLKKCVILGWGSCVGVKCVSRRYLKLGIQNLHGLITGCVTLLFYYLWPHWLQHWLVRKSWKIVWKRNC